jgi:PncC family amidohydrolase
VDDLLALLRDRHVTIAVAEGDTGGLLLEQLTAVPGSSAVVLGGVVAYHDDLKRQLLGVPEELLRQYGAVSAQAAEAMAEGVRRVTGSEVGVATTGIAGPGGATATKPVGLAYVAVATREAAISRELHFSGDRQANRQASVAAACALLREKCATP